MGRAQPQPAGACGAGHQKLAVPIQPEREEPLDGSGSVDGKPFTEARDEAAMLRGSGPLTSTSRSGSTLRDYGRSIETRGPRLCRGV